ncbi:hypothetical protein M9434_006281 [Picochlorum sp. BPE23]|nr:hypothetical protein M9434_006281 [Picochlorum sp. BPE23]
MIRDSAEMHGGRGSDVCSRRNLAAFPMFFTSKRRALAANSSPSMPHAIFKTIPAVPMISKNDVNAQGKNAKNKAASAYIIVSLRPRLKHFCQVEQPMQQLAVDTVAMLPVKETMSSSFSRPSVTFRMRRIDFADFQRSISCWPPNSSNASSVLKASLLTWHPQLGHLLFTGEPVTHWI